MPSPGPRSVAAASSRATPRSRSGWLNFPTPSSEPAWRRWRRSSSSPSGPSLMAEVPREVWITGIGIVSCLGEGAQAHWEGLTERRVKIDAERFAPYLVHPLAPLDLDKQIPKKGDQRQMEPWQRIGTYAAGLALADAGVHGVTGSSRTFMGEEAAGVDAVRIALARITAGQSELALVGGSHNGEREDLLLLYDAGGHMLRGRFQPVWERQQGMVLGSLGAFLVLESRGHAQARNAKPLGRLLRVLSERSPRPAGAITAALGRMWQSLAPQGPPAHIAVISGATGAQPATNEERAWLETLPGVPVRATGSLLGHGFEPQFAMNIALATLVLGREKLFPPSDSSGLEREYEGPLHRVAVTSVGHWRGEGMALIVAVS